MARAGDRREVLEGATLRGADIAFVLNITLDGLGLTRHEFAGKVARRSDCRDREGHSGESSRRSRWSGGRNGQGSPATLRRPGPPCLPSRATSAERIPTRICPAPGRICPAAFTPGRIRRGRPAFSNGTCLAPLQPEVDAMRRRSRGRLLVPFLLLVAAAGCGAAGEGNSPTAPSSAARVARVTRPLPARSAERVSRA